MIDDSKTVRQYHKHIITSGNLECLEAENGMEALEVLANNEDVSLFLVDINMPVMDGYTFVSKLREQEKYKHTPAIMISTEAQKQDRQKAYQAGANCYFVKPVKPDALIETTKILIDS
ncbi:MAG: response regulator [Campylobacterales bacterium]|nr:response regulator [Campylobacterales bacterium]